MLFSLVVYIEWNVTAFSRSRNWLQSFALYMSTMYIGLYVDEA